MERPEPWTMPKSMWNPAEARRFFTAYAQRVGYINHLLDGSMKLGVPTAAQLNFRKLHNANMAGVAGTLGIEVPKSIDIHLSVMQTAEPIMAQLDLVIELLELRRDL
jgi:hypothetical protein